VQTGDEIGFGASLNSIFTSLSEFRTGWWIRQAIERLSHSQ
jgi:hypothetical protein